MSKEAIQQYQIKIRELSTGDNVRQDAAVLLTPNTNWERFLTPIPLSVSALGHLLIATSPGGGFNNEQFKDFSLVKTAPRDGYKFISTPESFRATLVQLSKDTFFAFQEANANMGTIEERMGAMFTHTIGAMKIIVAKDQSTIERVLIPLNALSESTEICQKMASDIDAKFGMLTDLASELLEAVTAAIGDAQDKVHNDETLKEIKLMQKQSADEQEEAKKKNYEDMLEGYNSAIAQFNEIIQSAPGVGEVMGYKIVNGLATSVQTVISLKSTIISKIGTVISKAKTKVKKIKNRLTGKEDQVTYQESDPAFAHAALILTYVQGFDTLMNPPDGKEIEWGRVRKEASKIRIYLGVIDEKIKSPSTYAQRQVDDLCKRGVELAKEAEKHANNLNIDPSVINTLKTKVEALRLNAVTFAYQAQHQSGTPASTESKPQDSDVDVDDDDDLDDFQKSYKMKLDMSEELLAESAKAYKASCDNYLKAAADVTQAMSELAEVSFDLQKSKSVLSSIMMSIKGINHAREEWQKLVAFFHLISANIKIIVGETVKSYKDSLTTAQKRVLGNQSMSSLLKSIMFKQTLEISKTTYFLQQIAHAYTDLSNQYLMEPIISINRLLLISDAASALSARNNLIKMCDDAQQSLLSKVNERKAEYTTTVNNRIESMKSVLVPLLAIDDNSTYVKNTKEAISAGIEEQKDVLIAPEDDLSKYL